MKTPARTPAHAATKAPTTAPIDDPEGENIMKRTRTITMAAAVLALAATTACSDDALGPDDQIDITDDIALIAADATDEDLGLMAGMVPSGPGSGFGGFGDRTVTRSRTFFDADGAEMDAYDPLLTASIVTEMETSGDVSRGDLTLSIERSRLTTVSGLEGEETERTFDGTGTDSRTRVVTSDALGSRSFEFSGTLVIDGVVRAVDRENRPWPLAGTITRTMDITIVNGPNGDETRSTVVTVTFNGTQFATMTVDGETFEVDLAERGRDRMRRHRGGPGGP